MSCGVLGGLGQTLFWVLVHEEAVTAVDRIDQLPAIQLELEEPLGVVAEHQRGFGQRLRLVRDPFHTDAPGPSLKVLFGQLTREVGRLAWCK